MHKLLTGTALAIVIAATPAIAGEKTSASGETVTSPASENSAVSKPADRAGDNNATVVDEGTEATGAGSTTTLNAQGEPMSTTGKDAGMADGTAVEEGTPATSAGSEVILDADGNPVSSDDS